MGTTQRKYIMQIVIDDKYVHLDDEANAFLLHLKNNMSKDEVVEWLTDWLVGTIVPALLQDDPELHEGELRSDGGYDMTKMAGTPGSIQ
jgi:hypothetical protein